jgi:hypothetical protein
MRALEWEDLEDPSGERIHIELNAKPISCLYGFLSSPGPASIITSTV